MKSTRIMIAWIFCMFISWLCGCVYSDNQEWKVSSSMTEIEESEIEELETEDMTEENEDVLRYEVSTIALEDIAVESILCSNIFADNPNGCVNEETYCCYRDILAKCDKVSEYAQSEIMLLDSGDGSYPWIAFQTEAGIEIYGLETKEINGDHEYTGQLIPVTVLQREEEKDGICCKVTEVVTRLGSMEWQHQAWIRVCQSPQEKGVSQVLSAECMDWWFDLDRESSIDVWDVNDDGFLDILYDEGLASGSGGSWDRYGAFVWDETGGVYKEYDFPLVNDIDKENHKVYRGFQLGAPEQYYVIYGLKDGQYESYKELCLHYEYDVIIDEEGNYISLDKAIYSEWGNVIEETDITGLNWNETKKLLEEKYPEFTFWREG